MTSFISSPKNPRIQAACDLRDSKHRKKLGRFLIDGGKLVEVAAQHGITILELFVREGTETAPECQALRVAIPQVEVLVASTQAMQKLQYGEQSQDMIAVAQTLDLSLAALERRNDKRISNGQDLYLVLDRMEKPGNLGAVLRTADAVGVTAVFLSDPICDPWNPNTVRSSLGALFTVPIAISTEADLSHWLKNQGVAVYAARVEGATDYRLVSFPHSTAIVIGNEAMGLGNRWSHPNFGSVFIPMSGSLDSLNASVSTAVLMFEIARQRNAKRL